MFDGKYFIQSGRCILLLCSLLILAACAGKPHRAVVHEPTFDAVGSSSSNHSQLPSCASHKGQRSEWSKGWVGCSVQLPNVGYTQALDNWWWGERCVDGLSQGHGIAAWCEAGSSCDTRPPPSVASRVVFKMNGIAHRGSMHHCPVVIESRGWLFRGLIDPENRLKQGRIDRFDPNNRAVLIERYVGVFKTSGGFEAGAWETGGKIYITSQFVGNAPAGAVTLVIEPGGVNYLAYCRGTSCRKHEQDFSLEAYEAKQLSNAVASGAISEIEKQALKRFITRIIPRLATGYAAIALELALTVILG